MIKNERQYRITKVKADNIQKVVGQLSESKNEFENVHPIFQRTYVESLESQLSDLKSEIKEYEALRSGKHKVFCVESIDELPQALIRARIALSLSQKDLAERLRIKEQQVQRYEATEYAGASLTRIREVIKALGISVKENIVLTSSKISVEALFKRLSSVGIEPDFVVKRLLPTSLMAHYESRKPTADVTGSGIALQATKYLERVFGIGPSELFSHMPLKIDAAAMVPKFKMPSRADEKKLSAYIVYAHYLALIILECSKSIPKKEIPKDPKLVFESIFNKYGEINFENALKYIWDLGVPVLPLSDPGGFYGACWRVRKRNVIVLKQGTRYTARWLGDLLHELFHAAQEPELEKRGTIDIEEEMDTKDSEEREATQFAGNVMLRGRAEELTSICVAAAKNKVEWLKNSVIKVAKREDIPIGPLAYYIAFRLSLQGINWWGAATNLQPKDVDPWQTARDILLERISFENLNDVDKSLILQALR